jgi:hypothetical protein
MEKSNDDTFTGMVPEEALDLPSAVAETLTASGAPVEPDADGIVLGRPSEE